MTGLVGLLIGIGLRAGKQVSNDMKSWSDIPDWLFICVGLICLFWAGYATWNDKNQALIALQERLKAPELGGNFDIATGFSEKGHRFIFVNGLITNPLGPPTAITNWEMNVEYPDGHIVKGEAPITSGEDLKIPLVGQNGSFLLLAKNYWPDKSVNPIPAGGSVDGWFWSTFDNLDIDDAYKKKASVILQFNDIVSNKKHRLSRPLEKGIHLPVYNIQ